MTFQCLNLGVLKLKVYSARATLNEAHSAFVDSTAAPRETLYKETQKKGDPSQEGNLAR